MPHVREAAPADAAPVAALAAELGYPASAAEVEERLRGLAGRRDKAVFVATDAAGALAGWIEVHIGSTVATGPRAEISGLVVGAATRRGGIGRSLVERGERWARDQGVSTVVVRSRQSRAESHAFYLAIGYAVDKTQVVYRKRVA